MPSFNFSIIILLFLFTINFLSFTSEAAAPVYLYNFCTNTSTYTQNSTYKSNLNLLLSSLASNATRPNGFYNTTAGRNPPDIAYGLFLCRGDRTTDQCQECVTTASTEVLKRCPMKKVAVIWYDECTLRYSNQSIFATVAEMPVISMLNTANITDQTRFDDFLLETLKELTSLVENDKNAGENFATKEANFSSLQMWYTLGQCTPDLSVSDCSWCLVRKMDLFSDCCVGKQGGRILTPSCNVRYELYPFYNLTATASPPPPASVLPVPSSPPNTRGRKALWIKVSSSGSAALVGALLLGYCIFCRWRKKGGGKEKYSNSQEFQLLDLGGGRFADDYSNENLQGDKQMKSQDFPLIQIDLINVATQNFSNKNMLGQGGFGSVYKGTLVDGREIAVKRLSKTSGQGLQEFKNEVILIARLQHRNLVRLLGCCLEGDDLLLVYEYMPNKSLDVFLFDSTKGAQLDWKRRFGIICGVARGLLYLHEDSRLKIIHRDLKASNVLLDHNMNPKISDFGLARIIGVNQSEANTSRVVGTYGYMAPEYVTAGLFSVKSDIFSFGVLLLEIISGKRNSGSYLSEHGQTLIASAWKLWSEGQSLQFMDPLLVQSCVVAEVLKSIHIGLLCVQDDPTDRPTMSSVVIMLGSDVTLPEPTQPAFSLQRVVVRSPKPSQNNEICSVNEITFSSLSPR